MDGLFKISVIYLCYSKLLEQFPLHSLFLILKWRSQILCRNCNRRVISPSLKFSNHRYSKNKILYILMKIIATSLTMYIDIVKCLADLCGVDHYRDNLACQWRWGQFSSLRAKSVRLLVVVVIIQLPLGIKSLLVNSSF